jgi:transposase
LQSARNTLPEEPPGGVTAGIDWARDDHAVSVVDARGREICRRTVEHSAAGLRELVAVLARAGAGETAIERPDGPVIDALLGAGVTVVAISPNQVKNLRGRYGSAGNKDDRFDAFVLADTLRTDRGRLAPLTPDSPATVSLRRACRARKDLVSHRVGVANQLRAHLRNVFPGAAGLFAGDSRRASPWAADLYNRARARGHDHPHAVRILARAWLFVIWHCWQDGVAYDPARHRALQTLLKQDQQSAA